MRTLRKAGPLLALLLASCSDGGATADAPPGTGGPDAPGAGSPNTSITLAGDKNGTFPAVASAGKNDADATSTLGLLALPTPPGYQSLAAALILQGEPTARDYLPTDMEGGATITTTDLKTWTATAGVGQMTGTIGVLHLTSVNKLSSQAGTTLYTIHGSFSATLVPSAVGSGNVTMSATF